MSQGISCSPLTPTREEEKEVSDAAAMTRTFVWNQPVRIPSYLVAIAVGDLQARDISERWGEVKRRLAGGTGRVGDWGCGLGL
jgi:hypothetical protein